MKLYTIEYQYWDLDARELQWKRYLLGSEALVGTLVTMSLLKDSLAFSPSLLRVVPFEEAGI
jgi:hypothetical protein